MPDGHSQHPKIQLNNSSEKELLQDCLKTSLIHCSNNTPIQMLQINYSYMKDVEKTVKNVKKLTRGSTRAVCKEESKEIL